MRQAGPPRYEFKLRCEPYHLHQVHGWVRLHPAHWRATYPPRQVNNIYFDTLDHQSLFDNLDGVGTRQKLRLRWYGPDVETVAKAQLELKCKEGLIGWKETCALEKLTLDLKRQPWPDIRTVIRNSADVRAGFWVDRFSFPALINHYQRAYFATPDQTVRLTIDSHLSIYDQRFSGRPNVHRPLPVVDKIIIELKADRQYYSRLANLLSDFPIRIDRSSKFVQGMLATPDLAGVGLL
jgi:hypothetical protein